MTKKVDFNNPLNYSISPEFGKGCFYRAIRLQKKQDQRGRYIHAELEDCNHGFCVQVYFDQKNVIDIEARALRTPLTTCHGAIEPLKQLIGCPLGLTSKALSERIKPMEHCTHWLDLTCLAIQHASRDDGDRHYLVAAPDEADEAQWVTVYRNGEIVLKWLLEDWHIQMPASLKTRTLLKGFSHWANELLLDGDEREAAFILQKGYFVSRARRFDLDSMAGDPASNHKMMLGACYSYSEPQVSKAQRSSNSVRDFSFDQSQLLKFQ